MLAEAPLCNDNLFSQIGSQLSDEDWRKKVETASDDTSLVWGATGPDGREHLTARDLKPLFKEGSYINGDVVEFVVRKYLQVRLYVQI